MAWTDRIREAAYTSPSGVRQVFAYEDVGQKFARRTTVFEFPNVDGSYVQYLGNGGRQYPIQAIFWGEDHDLQADAFDALLSEPGVGLLEHPLYGGNAGELPEVLRTSFCGRFGGTWDDVTSDAGVVWSVVSRVLAERKVVAAS